MATIKKTTEDETERIITKTSGGIQRISCSCCEEVCCMYSGEALANGDLTFDDLPYEIGLVFINTVATAQWDGTKYVWENGFTNNPSFPEDIWIQYDSGYAPNLWHISVEGDDLFVDQGRNCLFSDDIFGFVTYYDLFLDVYTVNGPISGTVTRDSLCVWTGENLTLRYSENKWKINGNVKTGNQDGPVGTYDGDYSVEE